MNSNRTVEYDRRSLLLNGQRVFLTSGSIHYFRVPHELWADRLEKAKSFGLNCIQFYVPWNYHEPREEDYYFKGDADLDRFMSLCEKMGFYLIARPGPYICAEWDFGGFPAWLLTKPGLLPRRYEPQYLGYVDRWFNRLIPMIAKHQYTSGGGVILVQIENELGNICLEEEESEAYLTHLEKLVHRNGIDVPLITCAGSHKGTLECINGHYPARQVGKFREKQRESPIFSTEFYPGWYSTWHNPADWNPYPKQVVENETWRFLCAGASGYNYYMWHGGTNFGYNTMYLQTTSYDFTAPLSEAGGVTDKFRALARPARFASAFSRTLADCDPVCAYKIFGRYGELVAHTRINDGARFVFLENRGDKSRRQRMQSLGFAWISLKVPPNAFRMVVQNVDLCNGISLSECHLPILGLFEIKEAKVLVLEAADGFVQFEITDDYEISGDLPIRYTDSAPILEGNLAGKDYARADLKSGDTHLIILVVSPKLDNRVWPVADGVVIGGRYARQHKEQVEVHFGPDEQEAWLITLQGSTTIAPGNPTHTLPILGEWMCTRWSTELPWTIYGPEWIESYRPVLRDLVGSHHGYAWYRCNVREETPVQRQLTLTALADRALLFVNNKHVLTTLEPPEDRRIQPSASIRVPLERGENIIGILSDNLGHVKGDWQLGDVRKDSMKMHDDHKGLLGPVYLDSNELHFWSFHHGLIGERLGFPHGAGEWEPLSEMVDGVLRWFKTEFPIQQKTLRASVASPLRIRMEGLTKGVLWINGKHLGRYWTMNGHLDYYVPGPWLSKQNSLVIFEEGTGTPEKVRFVWDPAGACAVSTLKIGDATVC
ncbi:MAG TPA: beta-galactosidase [bacterium]|nr:beta-galactosidase [bacterium]